ncbi:TPA: replication protein, partial [Proteus mirabilis]|nr:replication protein [Proteus mirabilis]
MSLLLLKSRPLVVIPELAVHLGLNEAMLLQQIQYWLTETTSGVEYDG